MSRLVQQHPEALLHDQLPAGSAVSFPDRLLRVGEVRQLTGLGRNTIYTWMSEGNFPLPIDLGGCRVAWRQSEIAAWIASRPRVRSVRIKRGIKPWDASQSGAARL